MTEVKKGIGKAKIGLVASAVLVVILAVSSVWLYTRVDNLQKQVDSLEIDKNHLQDLVDSLLSGVSTFQHMPDATLSQSYPLDGTKYTVLNTTKNVKIWSIAVECTWTVQPTSLEIHITVDGISLTASQSNPVSNTWYYVYFPYYSPNPDFATSAGAVSRDILEGRSVKVEAEITGGAVSDIVARVKYAAIP